MRERTLSFERGQKQRQGLGRRSLYSAGPSQLRSRGWSGSGSGSSSSTWTRRKVFRSGCGCAAAPEDGSAATGTGSKANTGRIDLETFETSEIEISEKAMRGDWWKELPYVCVLLFSSDAGSQWFSVDLGDQSGSDNRIIGFESADDANLFRYIISNDSTYAGMYPRVQVVSPQDLDHASTTLDTPVFVLHEKQLLPSTGDSLEHICQLLHQRFYKETKLGIPYQSS